MKNTKRILAVLLLAALLVSSLLLSVSAETTFNAAGINDIEDIMEYYDLEDYLAENYEGGAVDTEHYSGVGSEIVADPTDASNNVLKVIAKNDKYSNYSKTDKLVVSFDVYFEPEMNGEYKFDAKMVDVNGIETLTYNTLFSLNAGAGVFQYSVWDASGNNGEGCFIITDFEGIAPVANTWFNVVIFFDASESTYSFKISADGKENWVYSESYSLGTIEAITAFDLKTAAKGKTGTVSLYLDNVEAYSGTFERNPANKDVITAQTLIDLAALYNAETTDSETKVRIAVVLDRLVNEKGYTPAYEATEGAPDKDEVLKIIADAPAYINLAFAEELINRAASIDVSATYRERFDFAEASEYYSSSIPANEDLASAPAFKDDHELAKAVADARAIFDAEKIALAAIAEDSIAFVKKMYTLDNTSADYDGYLKAFYEAASAYTNRDLTYTESIPGIVDFTMVEAEALFAEFSAKYIKLDTAASTFINGANQMSEGLSMMAAALETMKQYPSDSPEYGAAYENNEIGFGKLAEGYLLAKSVYNGGDVDENLDENTYADLVAAFSVYLANEEEVVNKIADCEIFLDIIRKAQAATYYTAIVEQLNAADECIANNTVRTKYAGVTEALAVYSSLKDYVEFAEKASTDYINAVNAILSAVSFEEKQNAIAKAVALKADGEVIGISGVKEASITLSEEMTKIETIISSSETIKSIVAQIENTTSFAERRALLATASQSLSKAEATIEGVAEAIEKFNAFMEEYTAAVTAANAAHISATEHAVDLAGAACEENGAYKAAEIIKNIIG